MSIDPTSNDDLSARAEARARGAEGSGQGANGHEEPPFLLHELRVHQIELELQNEELRRAQEELEASRARYFDLYDMAPVGYCTLCETDQILEANLTAAMMFGVTKAALVGKPLTTFIHRDSQDAFYRHRRQLPAEPAPRALELRFKRVSAPSFWAWVEIVCTRDQSGAQRCRVSFTDITLLKQAEATSSSETDIAPRDIAAPAELSLATAGAPDEPIAPAEFEQAMAHQEGRRHVELHETDDAIITADVNGRIVTVNHAAERIFGRVASEIIGKRIGIAPEPPAEAESARRR